MSHAADSVLANHPLLSRGSRALVACVLVLAVHAGCTFEGEIDAAQEPATGDALTELQAQDPVQTALDFGLSLRGTNYGWWYSGPLPKAQPMWTAAGAPPSAAYVRARAANCTGMTNLMLRKVGKALPWAQGAGTGGTAAYAAYYAGVARPFNANRSYPAGTLLGRRYRDTYDQGHVAVVLANGRVLQSFAWARGGASPGVNSTYTVAQSHDGGFYEYVVAPEDWLGQPSNQCSSGDGDYCGGNGVGGASNSLYRCAGGVATRIEVCANGCQARAAGTNDSCRAGSSSSAIVIDSNNDRNDVATGYAAIPSTWVSSAASDGFFGTGYAYASTQALSEPAEFWFHLDEDATRRVQAWWTAGANRSPSAPYMLLDASGKELATVSKDQRSNGGAWQDLGQFAFTKGWNRVQLSRWTTPGDVVIADAIRIIE